MSRTVFALVMAVVSVACLQPRISKSLNYQNAIVEFANASVHAPTSGDRVWKFDFLVDGRVVANVEAQPMSSTKIHFVTQAEPTDVYRYRDYGTPIGLRSSGQFLFVHWGEMLLTSSEWLVKYDVIRRRQVWRYRVDPEDMKKLK